MKFQYILLSIFGLAAVIAVIMFSLPAKKDPNAIGGGGVVQIWGTFPVNQESHAIFDDFNKIYKGSFSVNYQFHDPKDFDNDIVEALASGKGPDILLLPDDLVVRHSDKLQLIPYTSFPPETFRSNYIQAAEIYMRPNGLLALPFAVDPMVMYWNRDLFTNASLTQPPRYWDELLSMTPKLTKRDPKTSVIIQSAVSFGEYVNVLHAKDILAMLFLQVGNPLVGVENGKLVPKILEQNGDQLVPSEDVVSAFRFFMDFSNPQKPNYTWYRGRQNSLNEFINGNLAIYLDYASAYKGIIEKNPHLNFAVAPMPLPKGTKAEVTFTKVYGLGVLKSSKNKQTAFLVAQHLLADLTPEKKFAAQYNLPPVIRSLLATPPPDAALSVFYGAAIRGRTWLDPKPELSDKAFQAMVESVSSGRNDVFHATSALNAALSSALDAYK